MKRFAPILALVALSGCSEQSAPATPIQELDVAAASALFTAGDATPVDANAPATREAEGVVPGAVLLSSAGHYELSELPAGAGTLVFYCANEYCTASDQAAQRARDAGREVAVMRAGISGWKQAGQSTVPPSS